MEGACPPWTNNVLEDALPTVCVVTRTESNSGRSTSNGCLFVEVEANVFVPLFVNYSVRFQGLTLP